MGTSYHLCLTCAFNPKILETIIILNVDNLKISVPVYFIKMKEIFP